MPYRPSRSISLPIVLASITVALSIALLVGWTLVIGQNLSLTREVDQNTWLLVAGTISFAVIMAVMVLLCVFLVREILEARRHDRFIDSVTHELKSPLASLKLCLQTLGRSDLPEDREEALRQMMLGDVDRLSAFIDDVLEASRLSLGPRAHTLVSVGLEDLASRCAGRVARRHGLNDGAISVGIGADLELLTDATALEVVLRNLLDNAVKYSNEPVQVEITAKAENEGAVFFAVRDNGIGVPEKYLGRIFDRFYRVPSEAVRSRRGTGLGLYVVASIVRDLGGRIEAHSDGPGRGLAMEVWLPTAAVQAAEAG